MRIVNKIFLLAFFAALTGCIKETYDLNKFSDKIQLSPTLVIPAIWGNVSLSDLVKQSDTVIFEEDNFVRIILREESAIDLSMENYFDPEDLISFSETYQLGRMNISSFSGNIIYTLDAMSRRLNTSQRALFLALDGTNSVFPSFPVTLLQESTYPVFPNFENATFDEGFIDISVKNNLTAPVTGISVALFNTYGHMPVGNPATISYIAPGQTGTASIDLTNTTITNSLIASVTISSPGTTVPVYIDLSGSNIEVSVAARDLWVRSGRIIVPPQNISALGEDHTDTVEVNPGENTELTDISLKEGYISYIITSGTELSSEVWLTLPTALKAGGPVTRTLSVSPRVTLRGNMPVDNTVFDLSTITDHPYNMMPVNHVITVSSNGRIVNFSSSDEVRIDLGFRDPEFDYVKGYFGQKSGTFGPDTIDTGIRDIISKISGGLHVDDPSVKLEYSNSFAMPVEMHLLATAYNESATNGLDLAPFDLSYPAAPDEKGINGSFIIDKNNSKLPGLISMPPYMAVFRGTAKLNPDGFSGTRDNYIFGNSRITGSFELNIPLALRMNNLQFADTVDNFLRTDDDDKNSIDPDDVEFMKLNIRAENGFPAGISVSLILYDSEEKLNISSVGADNILDPAPVDNNGRVTSTAKSATTIDITREFWNSADQADNIIFKFTLNTTDGGLKNVRIYSDYRISFSAGILVKPGIKFKLD